MHWVLLTVAIVLEVAGTTNMKLSDGFTRTLPSVLIFVFYGLSFTAFTFALKKLDLSLSYAIWAGAGTALIAAIGVIWFKEPLTALKVGSIVIIVIGIVGLNMSIRGSVP
jgi:small multidrug resistance pump